MSRASHTRKSIGERFWAKVEKGDGCWEWRASRLRNGYGQFVFEGYPVQAHRVSYYLTYGPFEGYVLHACDNPPCVRPDHLHLGNQKLNMQEARDRGRIPNRRGPACPKGHLFTEANTRLAYGRRYCRACHTEACRNYRRQRGQLERDAYLASVRRDAKGRLLPRAQA